MEEEENKKKRAKMSEADRLWRREQYQEVGEEFPWRQILEIAHRR